MDLTWYATAALTWYATAALTWYAAAALHISLCFAVILFLVLLII
jgi:hypothetical protein